MPSTRVPAASARRIFLRLGDVTPDLPDSTERRAIRGRLGSLSRSDPTIAVLRIRGVGRRSRRRCPRAEPWFGDVDTPSIRRQSGAGNRSRAGPAISRACMGRPGPLSARSSRPLALGRSAPASRRRAQKELLAALFRHLCPRGIGKKGRTTFDNRHRQWLFLDTSGHFLRAHALSTPRQTLTLTLLNRSLYVAIGWPLRNAEGREVRASRRP